MSDTTMPSDREHEPILYVNGEYVPKSKAKISVFDHVVLYGDGVFEAVCGWNHALFKLDEHVDRLYESARATMLSIPLSKPEMREILIETLRRNDLKNAYVKVIVTRGTSVQPLLSPYNCTPGVIVFAMPYVTQADAASEKAGLRMITSSLRRVPSECLSTKIKSCNYLNNILMRAEANEAGADDALAMDMEGYVCEAPGYNMFMVKEGALHTPKDNILVGITRQTVIELAELAQLQVIEGRIQPFDLYNADEVFLTSTAGGIVPVTKLDGRTLGDGKPGPVTKELREQYFALLESGEQSTPVPPAR
ncbi:MAG: branched-chain-amino-acid transaminase [Acidobacteriota bacterium]